MKRKKRYSFLSCLLLILLSGGLAYTLLQNPAHDFNEQQCPDCHATAPEKGKRETLRMTASIQYLCSRCHGDQLKNSLSHPVEMVPMTALPPPDLPLSWEGKMTCSTCHDVHASSGLGLHSKGLLRRNVTGSEFCSACHSRDTKLAGNKGGHGLAMRIAHMKFSPSAKGDLIDRVSQMCLSCHDGSIGTSSDVQIRSGSWKHGGSFSPFDPQGSHPIGVRYRTGTSASLRPRGMLNPAIKLIDGKVGCRSCHDPFSKQPKLLVVSNNGAGLCLECHDK